MRVILFTLLLLLACDPEENKFIAGEIEVQNESDVDIYPTIHKESFGGVISNGRKTIGFGKYSLKEKTKILWIEERLLENPKKELNFIAKVDKKKLNKVKKLVFVFTKKKTWKVEYYSVSKDFKATLLESQDLKESP